MRRNGSHVRWRIEPWAALRLCSSHPCYGVRGSQLLNGSRRCLKTPRSNFCRGGLNIARVFSAVRGSRQLLVIALRCVGRGRLVLRLVACFLGSRHLLVIALHCVERGRLVLRLVACFLGSRQLLVIALHCVGSGSWFSGWLRVFLVVDSF